MGSDPLISPGASGAPEPADGLRDEGVPGRRVDPKIVCFRISSGVAQAFNGQQRCNPGGPRRRRKPL